VLFLYAVGFSFAQDVLEGVPPEDTITDSAPAALNRESEEIFVFDEAASDTNSSAGPSVFDLLRVVLVLGLVAIAIYGFVFFLKKQSGAHAEADSYLKVLARTAVSPKASAVVISVGDKAWLAGVTDEQVSLITEITDKEVVDAMLLDAANREIAAQSKRLDFRALLAKLSGGFVRSRPDAAPNPTASGIRAQADRLGRL
jgi:flagellar protein FliO/FliZ